MSGWWHGTWLVMRRNLVENLRSRTYRVITLLILATGVAATVLTSVGPTAAVAAPAAKEKGITPRQCN